jgi:hypothetical protein
MTFFGGPKGPPKRVVFDPFLGVFLTPFGGHFDPPPCLPTLPTLSPLPGRLSRGGSGWDGVGAGGRGGCTRGTRVSSPRATCVTRADGVSDVQSRARHTLRARDTRRARCNISLCCTSWCTRLATTRILSPRIALSSYLA